MKRGKKKGWEGFHWGKGGAGWGMSEDQWAKKGKTSEKALKLGGDKQDTDSSRTR